jgi:hypothetical protein
MNRNAGLLKNVEALMLKGSRKFFATCGLPACVLAESVEGSTDFCW